MNKPMHIIKNKCIQFEYNGSIEGYLEILKNRYDASRNALSIANKLKSNKHKSHIMSSMNELRSLITKVEGVIKKGD